VAIETAPVKDARLDLRMTSGQRETIEEAARISGSSVAGYAVTRLVESAQADILRNKAIVVSSADWETLAAVMDQPVGPKWRKLLDRTPNWATA